MPDLPDLRSIELDTDLEAAVARLERRRAQGDEPKFALAQNRFLKKKAAKAKESRSGVKKFIRPENATVVLENLPAPDERTHCVLRGDFVLCDLIPLIIGRRGSVEHLRIATLGLSVANAESLADLYDRKMVGRLTLVVSHYFSQVDKATVFQAVTAKLARRGQLVVTRCHAKVICLPTASGDYFVVEGSANLRSSDNLEQVVVTNDADTHAFHAEWIDELARAA